MSKHVDVPRCRVMAIVNLTPDSFYGASRNTSEESVMQRLRVALDEGADILDLGGYSSRPGAQDVSLEEEWRRVDMGLRAVQRVLRESERAYEVSIDTFRSEVVKRAVEQYGNIMVNDISAGELDERMLDVVAHYGLEYVAMHMRGVPQTMQQHTTYAEGVVRAVEEYFKRRVAMMCEAGIATERIILDPGFGFSKSVEQNFELLAGLERICAMGYPVLVGVSRKSMIYKPLGITQDEALPASVALSWEALRGGASILRVHDVAVTRQVVDMYDIYREVL